VCAVIFSLLCGFSVLHAQTFSGGGGTQQDPYKISTPDDLVELSTITNVNGGIASIGKYFVMTNNIDMLGVENFNPIGMTITSTNVHYFCGNFDGKGFAVKNLTIIDTASWSYQHTALFGEVKGAKITNLTLDKASFSCMSTGGQARMAAFVGVTTDSLYMDNCVSVNCTLKGRLVAGFVNVGGVINNCHIINATIEGYDACGFSHRINEITNSSVSNSTITGENMAFGFTATFNKGNLNRCFVFNCTISSARSHIGGFGYMIQEGSINNCGVQATLIRTQSSSSNRMAGFAFGIGNSRAGEYQPDQLYLSNCYAACEFTSVDNNHSRDYAFYTSINTDNTTVNNNYYKIDSKLAGGINSGSGVIGKSESDLKAAGIVAHPGSLDNSLNYNQGTAAWKQDSPVAINKGYPILAWQTPFSYVSTYNVENLAKESATLVGYVFTNVEPIIERGFQWREASVGTWATVQVIDTTNNFSHFLSGLIKGTVYEYFAYMKTANGEKRGDTVLFTTLVNASSVITKPATNITAISATLNGEVIEDEEVILERGFEWRRVGTTAWASVLAVGTDNISYSLTGLTPKTQYEFRAYIKTTLTRYGATLTFTTTDNTNIMDYAKVEKISIYPNPTSNQLQVKGYELQDVNYSIFSIVGQLLLQGTYKTKLQL